jgi:hypothetical protein
MTFFDYDGGMNVELAGHHLWNLRRAWAGANLCRDRLAQAENSAPVIDVGELQIKDLRGQGGHDVDYYAWESVRILKIVDKVIKARLRGHSDVARARDELRAEAPLLEEFRNQATHVEDNRGADDVVYFGDAVRLLPGGRVEYVVDPRYRQHDLLARLVAAAEAALLTLASADNGPLKRFNNSGA